MASEAVKQFLAEREERKKREAQSTMQDIVRRQAQAVAEYQSYMSNQNNGLLGNRTTLNSPYIKLGQLQRDLEAERKYVGEAFYKKASSDLNSMADSYKTTLTSKGEKARRESALGWLSPSNAKQDAASASNRLAYRDELQKRYDELSAQLPPEMENKSLDRKDGRGVYSVEDPNTKAIRDEMQQIKAQLNQYNRGQGVSDSYLNVLSNDDFEQNSKARNAGQYAPNAGDIDRLQAEKNRLEAAMKRITDSPDAAKQYDTWMQYSNELKQVDSELEKLQKSNLQYANAPAIEDKLQAYLENGGAKTFDAARRGQHGPNVLNQLDESWMGLMSEGSYGGWDYLTDKEIQVYNYYMNTGQQDTAYKFLEEMKTELNRRGLQAYSGYQDEFGEYHAGEYDEASGLEKLALNAASVGLGVVGGPFALASDAYNMARSAITGEDTYNPYDSWHSLQNVAAIIRGNTARDIDQATGAKKTDWFTWGDAYQAIMSGIDSYAGAMTFGQGYEFLMGTNAASSKMRELYEMGADKDQIIAGGLLSGAAETIFEHVSLEHFLAQKDPKRVLDIVRNFLSQSFAEGSEEFCTEVANLWLDAANLGSMSDWDEWVKMYGEKGAMMQAFDQALKAGAGGAISGGMMSGVGSIAGYRNFNKAATYEGQLIQDAGKADEAVRRARSEGMSKQTQAYADQYENGKGRNAKGKGDANVLGRMIDSIETDLRGNATKKVIREELTKQYGQVSDKYVDAVYKHYQNSADLKIGRVSTIRDAKELKGSSDFAKNVSNRYEVDRYNLDNGTSHDRITQVEAEIYSNLSRKGRVSETENAQYQGEDVEFKTFAEPQNGKAMVNLADGRTVDAGEVTFANDQDADFVDVISGLGLSASKANEMLTTLRGVEDIPSNVLSLAAKDAVMYGQYNLDMNKSVMKESFMNELTQPLKEYFYGIGQEIRNASYLTADNSRNPIVPGEARNTGKVHLRPGLEGTLTDVQNEQIRHMQILAGITRGDIYVFTSHREGKNMIMDYDIPAINRNKGDIAPNGAFDPKTGDIYIDLNAGVSGKGLMLYTLGHEFTHFIKENSPKDFRALADFLVAQYAEKGKSVEEMVKSRQRAGETFDHAFEEFVADSMESMLAGEDLEQKISALKESNPSVWKRLKRFVSKMLEDLRKLYKAYGPDSEEGKFVKENMLDSMEELSKLFYEGLVNAGKAYGRTQNAKSADQRFEESKWNPNNAAEAIEELTESFPEESTDIADPASMVKHSLRSFAESIGFYAFQDPDTGIRYFATADGHRISNVTRDMIRDSALGAMIGYSSEMDYITSEQAEAQYEMFAKIANMCITQNDFAQAMQFVGSAIFTGMKMNADKQYGTTYDFPSICTKTQAVIDAMSHEMVKNKKGLTKDEIEKLYQKVWDMGNPVPCPECYVFSRWVGIGGLLDNIQSYQEKYKNMTKDEVEADYQLMKHMVEQYAEKNGLSFGKAKGKLAQLWQKEYNKLGDAISKAAETGADASDMIERYGLLGAKYETVKAMTWIDTVYFADSAHKRVNKNFYVPANVLFDLNNGEAFANQYKAAWAFRTTQGAGYGKAITPYAEAVLGEGVLTTTGGTKFIKQKANRPDTSTRMRNIFLDQKGNLNKEARTVMERARKKQLAQAFLGGQRLQSTSDARYENMLDYLIAAVEMQAMHSMAQVYTKVSGAVPAFNEWGFSGNMSLMPLNNGFNAKGEVADTATGGMKADVAFTLREQNPLIGTITIGVNDAHIRAMFKQRVRDFIIPYHASGGDQELISSFRKIQDRNIARGKMTRSNDYSRVQGEKLLKDGALKALGKTDAEIEDIMKFRAQRLAILTGKGAIDTEYISRPGNEILQKLYDEFKVKGGKWYGATIGKGKVSEQIYPNEYWDTSLTYDQSAKITQDYLDYCDRLGMLHKFSGLQVKYNNKTGQYQFLPVSGYDQYGNKTNLTDLAYIDGDKANGVEPFFWKVLTDRRMYDNDGKYIDQHYVSLGDGKIDVATNFAKRNTGSSREYSQEKSEATIKALDAATNRDAENAGMVSDSTNGDAVFFSERVSDPKLLESLNQQIEDGEYETVYRSFQVIDGKLYAPMNAVDRDEDGKNKRLGYSSEIGKREMATESPAIAQRYMDNHPEAPYAKFDLDGVDNKTGGVAYNPYLHASNLVMNDQFTAAYRRNLVVVECRVPKSEIGAYKAQYAKDSTGWVEWKPGGVAGKLAKLKPEYTRKLFVSRYMLPVRILSDAEVADKYAEYLEGTGLSVPWNVVVPGLREELVKRGVEISYADVKRGKGYDRFEDKFPGAKFSERDSEDPDIRFSFRDQGHDITEGVQISDKDFAYSAVILSGDKLGETRMPGKNGNGSAILNKYAGTGKRVALVRSGVKGRYAAYATAIIGERQWISAAEWEKNRYEGLKHAVPADSKYDMQKGQEGKFYYPLIDVHKLDNEIVPDRHSAYGAKFSESGVKYKDRDGNEKDARKLTELDLRHLLEMAYNGALDDGTYIPMLSKTPQTLIDIIKAYNNGEDVIMQVPMAATVKHVRQNMEEPEDGADYGGETPHELSADGVVAIAKAMTRPDYVVLQENGRYAEVVTVKDKKGKKIVVSISLAAVGTDDVPSQNYKYSQYMNGYATGFYNIIVTQLEKKGEKALDAYLAKCKVIAQKKNGTYQVGSGRVVTVTHESPFFSSDFITSEPNVQYDNDIFYKMFGIETDEEVKNSNRTEGYDILGSEEISDSRSLKTGYENVSDQLLGFGNSPKSFDESKYPFNLRVWVSTDGGSTFAKDEIKGMNRMQAIERARRNWPDAIILDRDSEYTGGLREGDTAYYSERTETPMDNRTILSNALKTAAVNDYEWSRLKGYQKRIGEINKWEAELSDVRRQIREAWFAKGGRDMKKISELRKQATILTNRITTQDKVLVRLEASEPLQKLLDREKEKVRQEGRENLSNYREQVKVRFMKEKLQKMEDYFRNNLLNPDSIQYVPHDFVDGIANVITAMDAFHDRDNQRTQKWLTGQQAIAELRRQYDRLKDVDDYSISSEHSEEFSEMIGRFAEAMQDTLISDMTSEQLSDVYAILRDIKTALVEARKLIGREERISAYQSGASIIENMDDVRAKGLNDVGKLGGFSKFMREWTLNPMRAVREMSGFEDGAELVKLFNDLNEGVRKSDMFRMQSNKYFEDLVTGDNLKRFQAAVEKPAKFELLTVDGKPVKMSKMQAMTAILTWKRETSNANRAHLETPVRIPDVELEVKGKYQQAFDAGQEVLINKEAIDVLMKGLDDWDRAYMNRASKYFNEMAKDAMNTAMLLTRHRIIALEKDYIPYSVNKDYINRESENLKFDASIASMGITKTVKASVKNQLVIGGLNQVLGNHINNVAKLYGLSVPVRNWNKVWNMRLTDDEGGASLRDAIRSVWKDGGVKLLEQAVADLQSPRRHEQAKVISEVKGAFVQSTLASNLSVWMKQFSSFPTAGYLLGGNNLVNGLVATIGVDTEALYKEIDEHTAAHWIRRQGLAVPELAEINQTHGWQRQLNAKMGKLSPMNWIQAMDVFTTATLWNACKSQIAAKEPAGTKEYWKHVTDLFNSVIEETQPMYDPLHRAEIAKNTGLGNFIMFQTQPLQNSGILREGFMKYRAMRKAHGVQSNEAQQAFQGYKAAVKSQIASHLLFTFMTLAAAALTHRMNPWRDKDKELTAESVAVTFGEKFGENVLSAMFPILGTYAISLAEKIVGGSKYDVISDPVADKINSSVDYLAKLRQNPSLGAVGNVLLDVASYFGVPASNAWNIFNGMRLHVMDFINGEPFTFEAGTSRTASEDEKRLYEAYTGKNTKVINQYKQKYKEGNKLSNEIRRALKSQDPRITEAAKARLAGDQATYYQIAKQIRDEKIFSQDDIVAAINSMMNELDTTEKAEKDPKHKGLFTSSDIEDAIAGNRYDMIDTITEDLINTRMANGDAEATAEEKVMSSLKSAIKKAVKEGSISMDKGVSMMHDYFNMDTESATKQLQAAFKGSIQDDFEAGTISADKAVSMLQKDAGMSSEDAASRVQYWQFKEKYPEYSEMSETAVSKYYSDKTLSGTVPIQTFAPYYLATKNMTGVDRDGDGKSDPYTKMDRIIEYISKMNVSKAEKDILFRYYYPTNYTKYYNRCPWH